MIRRLVAFLGIAAVLALAGPACAEWRRAESPRFIVYSEGSEAALRDYVRDLETYDFILRGRFGIEANEWDRKLPIYLVDGGGLNEVRPGLRDEVAGIYLPTSEEIFAVALRGRQNDFVLLHEYFHHLSFQAGGAASDPAWLIEGLAEYYMTAEISEGRVRIGGYNENRAYWLVNEAWIPLDQLLTRRPDEIRRSAHAATYYPVSWLLTHWFLSDKDRTAQLQTYIQSVAAGAEPLEAIQAVTGLTVPELTRVLRAYIRQRILVTTYTFEPRPIEITVTTLPRVEGDLLLLAQRAKVGTEDEDLEDRSLAEIRRRAGRYPDEPFAIKLLGHAEAHQGDQARGEELLKRYLELRPDDVEAMQWLAAVYMRRAEEAQGDAIIEQLRLARALLARAYGIDPENHYTLYMLAQTRTASPSYPTENDVETWRQAFVLAPQLPGIRLGLGAALMSADRDDEAIGVLTPLANAPHAEGAGAAARTLIEQARAGEAPLALETLEAAAEADVAAEPEVEPLDAAPPVSPDEATQEEAAPSPADETPSLG